MMTAPTPNHNHRRQAFFIDKNPPGLFSAKLYEGLGDVKQSRRRVAQSFANDDERRD
jgi:hypothetical protein